MTMLTATEVADRLKLHKRTVYQLAAPAGPIPSYRIGRSVRFLETDIEEFEQSCRSTTIRSAVAIALNSRALSTENESGLRSYFQQIGIKPGQTSSTGKKAAASTQSRKASNVLSLR